MKNTIVFLLLVLSFRFSFAQTFHLVMIGDTEDNSIGISCDRDIDRISSESNTIAQSIGYQLNRVILKDEKFDPELIKKTLQQLKCGKEDILYFHYSGHGVRNESTITEWPDMDFKEKGTLPLMDIIKIVQTKAARLRLIFADCCNQFSGTAQRPTFQAIPSLTATESAQNRRKLFTEEACLIIASGSQPGQFSYGTYEDGGHFTNSFLESLQYTVLSTYHASWQNVMQDTQLRTKTKAWKEYKKQFPQFKIEVIEDKPAAQNGTASTKPKVETLPITEQNDLITVNKYLNSLVSTEYSDKEKEGFIKSFKKYFHANARVDVYKNTTLVDRESIEDFLQRIYLEGKAITHINLIENKCQLKEGKYAVITIQEMRLE